MSADAFLSPQWYRVAGLRPVLKAQARIRRQRFRGHVWYVVQDRVSGRFHRFTPATYQLLGLMNGARTVDEVWKSAVEQLGDDAPGQESVIRLLSQLHAADLLHCRQSPDLTELFERFAARSRSRQKSNFRNPFSIRFPLWNPDRFLRRTLPYVQPLLSWWGSALYVLTLAAALAAAVLHWPELSENVSDRVLAADNLLPLAISFAVLKLLHELGHAYAARAGGGEVHEMGILLLVFMPVPYVDASAAHGFRSKWRRVFVGAAGMLTELFIASLCMFAWVLAEPGWARALAFNAISIAGVSTLLFNANPLLRFDGYFILSDLIEIPNLAQRSNRYWRYLAERHLFRMPDVEAPPATNGERRWFLFYAPAALVYRVFVLVAVLLFVASQWFFVGVVLALWALAAMLLLPLTRFIGYIGSLPRAARVRRRALSWTAAAASVVAVAVLALPAPFRIQTEGVLWLPQEAHVRAETDGFVRAVLVPSGTTVPAGAALVESDDPVLSAEARVSESRIGALQARFDQQLFSDRVEAEVTRQELLHELAHYRQLRQRAGQLIVRSGVRGQLLLDRSGDLPGRFVHKGDVLGYVVHDARKVVRIVVSQDDVDLVRSRLVRIDVRLAERLDEVHRATVLREVPLAKEELPSSALSSQGGGKIAADPRDPKGVRALASTFQFDLALADAAPAVHYGGRAHVRLVLQPEPLAQQALRRLRQLFLALFHV